MGQFNKSIESGETRVGIVSFTGEIPRQLPYTSDLNSINKYVDRPWEYADEYGTAFADLFVAIKQILETDPKSRLNDNNVRKLVFIVTDGKTTSNLQAEKAAVDAVRRLPTHVYAVGVTHDSTIPELQKYSSDKNYVRVYKTFQDFENDAVFVFSEICRIETTKASTVDSGYGSGSDLVVKPTKPPVVQINLKDIEPGQTKFFRLKYSQGYPINFEPNLEGNLFVFFISFTEEKPRDGSCDIKFSCSDGSGKCSYTIEASADVLKNICFAGAKISGIDGLFVAAECVGPYDYNEKEAKDVDNSKLTGYNQKAAFAFSERLLQSRIVKTSLFLAMLIERYVH
ncbi:uncharacterized protein LOC134840373 [Symsagittifera roscoffensis]|uniref:uncharacterized protein LOC134840373 n=1 Tax=Symsagittifera roscoffensis TaxID=84072 RepID=UPI00307CA97B